MRWTRLVIVIAFLAAGLILSGCGKGSRPRPAAPADAPPAGEVRRPELPPGVSTGTYIPVPDRGAAPAVVAGPELPLAAVPAPVLSPQEQYDAALLEALNLLAEHKPAEALLALAKARAAQDTEQVREQIDRLKARIDQQQAAERTVQDIQTVLQDGKADEAARLATAGLQQYGGGDTAETLTRLKREADALTAAGVSDQTTQRDRCRREAEAALQDQNLRAAALAFEQALQYGEDADLRRRLDEVRGTLTRYDDNRRRAAELRRDPANLEDALAALQEAARAWDTPQVRQEIDEYTLALQKRRDRLSVADFEVRGDVGMAAAGRTVAEQLLPAFRPRFDLVERNQIGRVIEELKLEASGLADNEAGRREVGRLANVRYLVLGSITALNGVTVNARLVDVRSGLIVQTAQLVARTPEELLPRLSQLASLLQMSDEQKMAFAQQLAQQCAAPPPAPVVVALPPPPEAGQSVPPPLIVYTPRPPDFGGLRPADFEALPPPGPAVAVVVEREDPVRQRLLNVSVELGDNLFRRGRYREAHTQFQLALSLSPHHQEISLRIEKCRPYLPPPPPPVVVVTPVPPVVVVARPRIAVLSFVVNADPGRVPPAFGDWAAEQVASYFTPAYEVVERGEVCWYMGRLGLTMRDVLVNPSARLWLGRALNVRFFVFGAIQQTASFDVATHLVDVESGAKQGGGKIHVQDHQELKLRIGELVQQTRADPTEQSRLQQEAKETEKVLNQARALYQKGQAEQAAAVCREGLKRWPNHAGLQALLQQAEQKVQQAKLDQERQRALAAQQAQAAALQKRRQELAREAEAARQRAAQAAAARTEAERRAQEAQRQKAYDDLVAGGRRALQQGNYPQAIQQLQSAVALKPSEAGQRELALARAKADEAARQKAAADQARRDAELRKQHEAELARVRQQVAEQQKKKQAEEQARRQAQEARDQAAYTQLLNQGRQQLAQGKLDAAAVSFQSARQLKATKEVDDLLKQAHDQQARAAAQKQGADAQAALERRKAEEKAARDRADAQAKKNQDLYNQALAAAQKALAEKRYDEALAKYQEAGRVFRTDVVLNGIRLAEEARAASLAQTRRQQEDQARLAKYRTTMDTGKAHLAAKRYDEAVVAFTEAVKLNPADPGAAAALREAQQAREASAKAAAQAATQAAEARKREEALRKAAADAARQKQQQEEQARAAQVRQWLTTGRNALNAGQLDAAGKAFAEAGKLAPADPAVKQALQDLDQDRKKAAARPAPPPDPRRAQFDRLLTQGKAAMTAKKYEDAVKVYTEALKLQPGDPGATAALKEANQALQASKSPPPKK